MSLVRIEELIPSDIESVWNDLANLSSHVEWMADAEAIRFVTPQTEGPGTVFECDTKIGPFKIVDRLQVTKWVPNEEMTVAHFGAVTGTGTFRLQPSGEGVKFTWEENLHFPWFLGGPLGKLVAGPIFKRVWSGNLRRFRQRYES